MTTKKKSITEKLQDALPEIREQQRICAELRKFKRSGNPTSIEHQTKAERQVKERILELIITGQEIPDDVALPILEARSRDELMNLRGRTLDSLARDVIGKEQTSLAVNAEDTIAFLRGELERIVSEVRTLSPELESITSADEAIHAGGSVVAAWQGVTRCAEDYDEIRQLQRQLYTSLRDDLTTEAFLRIGILADSIDVVGYWIDRRRQNAQSETRGGVNPGQLDKPGADYREWLTAGLASRPFDYNGQWWQDDESRTTHLIRLVKDATPWLPSIEDMQQADRYAAQATTPVNQDRPEDMQVARRAYYDLTGARPAVTLPDAPKFVRNTAPYSGKNMQQLSKKISNAAERAMAERQDRNVREAMAAGRD